MNEVRQIAEQIVAREGGYSNDPDDPGGPTNFGVTIGRMRDLNMDLDGDGRVTSADVRRLSRAQAVEIFIEHYYVRPGLNHLPEVLRASVFDMTVNAGVNGVRILQRTLTDMGLECTADGVVGPQTIALAKRAVQIAPHHLADAYGIARRNYYYAIADGRPASRKYARRLDGGKGGWIKRAEEFIAPIYHLTRAQHDSRVTQWA